MTEPVPNPLGSGNLVERLESFVESELGLNLSRGGTADALHRFVQREGEASSSEILRSALAGQSAAFQRLVDAVTVQHSWLFRDLEQLLLACTFASRTGNSRRPLRIWVPACATGEDVYSLAAICASLSVQVELLGTDVNRRAVQSAREGRYDSWSARRLPPQYADILEPGRAARITERIKQFTQFAEHNLLNAAPSSSASGGRWDLIVCRNALIYFSPRHSRQALQLLGEALVPGGGLVLGASDMLAELPSDLVARNVDGRVIYQRIAPGGQSVRPPTGGSKDAFPVVGAATVSALGSAALPAEIRAALRGHTAPKTLEAPSHAQIRHPAAAPTPSSTATPDATDAEAAIHYMRDGAEATPDATDAEAAIHHMRAGAEKCLAGELREAIKELRAALFLDSRLWPAAYYLALAYDSMGRAGEARRQYALVVAQIESGEALPAAVRDDYAFLERDFVTIARRRATEVY